MLRRYCYNRCARVACLLGATELNYCTCLLARIPPWSTREWLSSTRRDRALIKNRRATGPRRPHEGPGPGGPDTPYAWGLSRSGAGKAERDPRAVARRLRSLEIPPRYHSASLHTTPINSSSGGLTTSSSSRLRQLINPLTSSSLTK